MFTSALGYFEHGS